MTDAKDLTQMTDEDLAKACVRTGKNPVGESRAMIDLLKRLGVEPRNCQVAATRLWRDSKTAAEILAGVRAMADDGAST